MKVFKNLIIVTAIFLTIVLIDSYRSYFFYVEYRNITDNLDGVSEIYYAEKKLNFSEEKKITAPSGVDLHTTRYYLDRETVTKTKFLRIEPCNCIGVFEIVDWGYGQGLVKKSLMSQPLSPYSEVRLENGLFISEGANPQLLSQKIELKNLDNQLYEQKIKNYLIILIGIIFIYYLIIRYSHKITMWWIVFLFPLFYLTLIYLDLRHGYKIFLFIYKLEGPGEAFQGVSYMLASSLSFFIFLKLKNKKQIKYLHLFYSIVLFYIFLEETSFLQRLFLYRTPKLLAENNLQGEFNAHNIAAYQGILAYLFMIAGVYGALGWIFLKIKSISKYKISTYLFPPKVTFFYFFSIFLFYYLYKFNGNPYLILLQLQHWRYQEVFELLLALGILFFITNNFRKLFTFSLKQR